VHKHHISCCSLRFNCHKLFGWTKVMTFSTWTTSHFKEQGCIHSRKNIHTYQHQLFVGLLIIIANLLQNAVAANRLSRNTIDVRLTVHKYVFSSHTQLLTPHISLRRVKDTSKCVRPRCQSNGLKNSQIKTASYTHTYINIHINADQNIYTRTDNNHTLICTQNEW